MLIPNMQLHARRKIKTLYDEFSRSTLTATKRPKLSVLEFLSSTESVHVFKCQLNVCLFSGHLILKVYIRKKYKATWKVNLKRFLGKTPKYLKKDKSQKEKNAGQEIRTLYRSQNVLILKIVCNDLCMSLQWSLYQYSLENS